MANEFSKGKWRILEGKSGKGYFVVAGENENHTTLVADCDVSILLPHREKVANAKLIASAPDMLKCCERTKELLWVFFDSLPSDLKDHLKTCREITREANG